MTYENRKYRDRVRAVAVTVLEDHGHQIVRVLREYTDAHDTATGPANLVAIMEIFASKLDTIGESDIVARIDARMGNGWARQLADALQPQPGGGAP